MVKVGLVTGPVTPSARQAPRTNVVLPDAELAGDGDDIARLELRGERRSDALGLLRPRTTPGSIFVG